MKEYTVYVPLKHPDGKAVDASLLAVIKQKLIVRFEGCMYTVAEIAGSFSVGPVSFTGPSVGVFQFLADDIEHANDFLHQLQEEAVFEWKLGAIAVIERGARLVL